jgi:histidinol-phosphate aminotransferase
MENNRISTSPQAIAAIKEGISTIYPPPPLDASELRAAIAKKYGLSPEHVAVGNGSTELINILAQQRVTGSQLLISAPTFSLYPALGKLYNYTIEAIPLRNYTHDTQHIIKAITPETCILFLDSPHYITGTSLTMDEIKAICQAAHKAIVVLDNVYGEYQTNIIDGYIPTLIKTYKNVVICRTFSKIHALLGLRIGYMMGSPEIITAIQRYVMPYSVNAL